MMPPERNTVLAALDDALRLVRDYIMAAPPVELGEMVGLLSELIRARRRFERATNPLLLLNRGEGSR